MSKSTTEAFWSAAEQHENNLQKDPFYYQDAAELKKENAVLKRTITSLQNVLKAPSAKRALGKQELEQLDKAKKILDKLLNKKAAAIKTKNREAADKARRIDKAAVWLRSELGEITTELKVKVVLSANIAAHITYFDHLNNEFRLTIEKWAGSVKTKEDAKALVKKFRSSIGDSTSPLYFKFAARCTEILNNIKV